MNHKRIDPSKHLYQDSGYVTADKQKTDGILARWLWERSSNNPTNYAEYQQDVLAEKSSMQIRGYGR